MIDYERMFNAAVASLAEVSKAAGVPDDEAATANGNELILERIATMRDALLHAETWIGSAPHGDNCYVSDHYAGDPGNRCNCGKESALASIEQALEGLRTDGVSACDGQGCGTTANKVNLKTEK